jgi:mannose-6-phosphate isomerase
MRTMVFLLENAVQPYAWGSPTAIPELFGVPNPTGGPIAEIWMGAHPKAPSQLVRDGERISLARHIEEDPIGVLGEAVARRFDNRLPFLYKVLAAAQPLSIQAHPTLDQARAGFAREEAAGIPRDAAERNYRDDNHKPELIYALTPFWGLRGFRSPAQIRSEFSARVLSPPESLRLPQDESGLKGFFASLMVLPVSERQRLLDAAVHLAQEHWPNPESHPEPGEKLARYFWLQRLSESYPGDVGVLAPLFLNVFSLNPGEATYQPAGVLHAYLEGTGMELMANSDNVLRGGLTPKHVDLDELLAVGMFRTEELQVVTGRQGGSGAGSSGCPCVEYPAPFEEFVFSRIDVRGRCEIETGGPQILFCSAGSLSVSAGGPPVLLATGDSAFVSAQESGLGAEGNGTLLRATVGRFSE